MALLSSKNKLMEAAMKEKDFDAYFCLALVLQSARNVFIMEIGKNVEVYVEVCENINSALVVKKIFRNLVDNHSQRKLKISKESKIDKILKHLITKNEEVDS